MESNLVKQFHLSFREILIDEIALEGLEGIGFDLLWRRVEKRMSSPVTDKMKARFWGFIHYCEAITLYAIPEALGHVEILDRFEMVDEETGNLIDPPVYPDGPFEYHPASDDYGSCMYFKSRRKISKNDLNDVPYEKVLGMYGDKLVMVASLEERWKALAPHMAISTLKEITKTQYCLLEIIGKGRENGQMTIGNTNLTKVVKDSKLLFYNRKFLQDADLIRMQAVPQQTMGRSVKGLLLRLKRFHQPPLLTMPKKGKIYDVAQYLLKQQNYADTCKHIMDIGLATQTLCKKLYKNETAFSFEDIPKPYKKKFKQMTDKIIRLEPPSDHSGDSEGEVNEELKCQYQVKVNLLRQGYEKILEAGFNGLTQVELAQILGIEYYTARTMCRMFKAKNLVKEIFVDKGKQRVARFVAAASAVAIDAKFEEEKKKFMQMADESKNSVATSNTPIIPDIQSSDSESEVPKKKPKLSDTIKNDEEPNMIFPDSSTIENTVTEVKYLDGCENKETQPFLGSRRTPTMRQLKFANGVLKTIKEREIVSGYMSLNVLASKESNEPPVDSKCLKTFVQKMVMGGQIKLLKMTWPQWHKSCILFCAPHVKATDEIIVAKYKELSLQMLRNKRVVKEKKEVLEKVKKTGKEPEPTRPLAMSLYPRYLKLQKLHEFLIKQVYFTDDKPKLNKTSPCEEGFSSLIDLIPEFTVEFVIGNMSSVAVMAMCNVHIPHSMLQMKLRDVPENLFKNFLATPALQNTWRQNLKVLSTLGLIQLIMNKPSSDENQILTYEFYVNRHPSIIDTTGVWPREKADIEALRKHYYFETFDDVEGYWKDVYDISVKTKVKVDPELRSRKQPFYVPRLREEVHLHDNGQVPGNGLGPCGFDATFFMELPKLWALSLTRLKSINKPSINIPKRRKRSKQRKTKAPIKQNIEKPPVVTRPKTRNRPPPSSIPKWSKEEDRLIMLCKAAITVFSPTASPGCLRLRNYTAKDILTIFDRKKTASNCHKRAVALESNPTLAFEKDCLLNELRRHPVIIRKYEGIFKMIRYCGNPARVVTAARLPMLELVYTLLKLITSTNFNQKIPCVALNLDDFHKKFTICPSTVNRNYNTYKTPLDGDPALAAIKEAIMVAVMTTYRISQSSETAKKIHSMFRVYPEQRLRPAIEQLRRAGAVAAREKMLTTAIQNYHFKDIAQSSYKLSFSYTRHWVCRMNSEFADDLMFSLDEDLPSDDLKGSTEMNCLLFEAQANDVLDLFSSTTPEITSAEGSLIHEEQMTVTEMLMSYKIKVGMSAWKYKKNINKLSELYEHIKYDAALECLLRDSYLQKPPENIDDVDDIIVSHLKNKKSAGATFEELQIATGYDSETLQSKLKTLESQNIVKRLGYFENFIMLSTFAKPWTIAIKDKQVIPTPWLTMDVDIRNDVFLKWGGTVVNTVFRKPGCSISYLADECEYLSTRAAQDICMVLEKCKCVILKTVNVPEPDLFSEEYIPELEDFNQYKSVENTLVFPVKDMLTRYSFIRKQMFDDEYYFEKK